MILVLLMVHVLTFLLISLWFSAEAAAQAKFHFIRGKGCVDDQNHKGLNPGYVGECGDLFGVDLHDQNLKGHNFRGANLERANLGGANLEGADFIDANLKDANLFQGANLRDALFTPGTRLPFSKEVAISLGMRELSYDSIDAQAQEAVNKYDPSSLQSALEVGADPQGGGMGYLCQIAHASPHEDPNSHLQERIQIAQILIRYGADVNQNRSGHIVPPLSCAIHIPQIVTILLEAGANPNITPPLEMYIPLVAAARENAVASAELLLAAGADPDKASPLSYVRTEAMAKLFLGAGAKVNLPPQQYEGRSTTIVDRFFGKNLSHLDNPFFGSPVEPGQWEPILKAFKESGFNFDQIPPGGFPYIFNLILRRDSEKSLGAALIAAFDALVAVGVDPLAKDSNGDSILAATILVRYDYSSRDWVPEGMFRDRMQLVRHLLTHGFNIDEEDVNGETILFRLASLGDLSGSRDSYLIVYQFDALLELHPNLNAYSKKTKETILMRYQRGGSRLKWAVEKLLKAGADPNFVPPN